MPYDNAWAAAWAQSSDVNIATQVQDVTAFNGAGNINAGNFTVGAAQDVGDTGASASDGWGNWGDVNVGTQVQNVTAFNGAGNVNGGDFTVFADQDVGGQGAGGPINDYNVDVVVDFSSGVNVGVQVQNVTAFNGVGNINGADFLGSGDQGVGDPGIGDQPPPVEDMPVC